MEVERGRVLRGREVARKRDERENFCCWGD
jgi:hypothetical protein